MRFYKLAVIALIGGFVFMSCNDKKADKGVENKAEIETVSNDAKEVTGTVETATFQVDGMTCEIGCAKLIEGKLAGLNGVKVAKVDFETKTATVEFDDAKQNVESLIATVEKIANGIYKVENMNVGSIK
ncbi:heavy-metal-associated domain-containing protein [Myroides sp. LoEW2-1]|uniref:heavy-metal-associated domain-containing protein n=1 Tax=Myroides sp. LoEW2-1 TaxID=2683192 RepID=UPI0013224ED8|nr:heavy-metal-associated domain-containing protein [Myroides sp. LoEW2-1]MVX36494.1 heavy metal transporter [Myroides sp. LoEW2-1]